MPLARYRKAANAYLADRRGELVSGVLRPLADGSVGPQEAGQQADPDAFRWSDSWPLMAIKSVAGTRNTATLENIIAAGDAINHAIFTDAEMEGGFSRLLNAGFITVDGETCAMTKKFIEAWDSSVGGKRRGRDSSIEAARKFLGAPPWES